MEKEDKKILALLRGNGRAKLTKIAKRTGMPISTLFDKVKLHYKPYVQKYTCLLDFEKLGYKTKAYIVLQIKDRKEELIQHLYKHFHVNTLFRINNGWDVLVEVLFEDMKDLEAFLEKLEQEYPIKDKKVHYVLDEITREAFFSDPDLLP